MYIYICIYYAVLIDKRIRNIWPQYFALDAKEKF